MDRNNPFNKVNEVLVDSNIQFYVSTLDDFNKGCIHIVQLLRDSYLLYINDSYSTSVFMSITAIEEIVKLHIGMYRKEPNVVETSNKKKDKLFNHDTKHILASIETLKMGSRLNEVIGDDMIDNFIKEARNGVLKHLRESALYCEVHGKKLTVPMDVIDKSYAQMMILIAIEIWDDSLVGYTEVTFRLREKTDEIFNLVSTNK